MTHTPEFVAARNQLLEDVLRMVRLSGAVFLKGEFARPWGFETPSADMLTAVLAPGAEQLVIFHVVLEGECVVSIESGESVELTAGEVVVLPYGDLHRMTNPGGAEVVPIASLLDPLPWERIQVCCIGDQSKVTTRILCSYLECRSLLFNPFLDALPRIFKVAPVTGAQAEWFKSTLRYAQLSPSEGLSDSLRGRLPEMLLVDAVRHFLADQPPDRAGLLAAIADPVVGPALILLHTAPERAWTVADLAARLAVSRSVLAARFVDRLHQSPMRYLALWRLQLAQHLLRSGDFTVGQVALRVGYESEPAFNRAFKRQFGTPPGVWRSL